MMTDAQQLTANEQYEDEDKEAQQDFCGMCELKITDDVGDGARENCQGCCKHEDGSQKLCSQCDLCDCGCHEDTTDSKFFCPNCHEHDRYLTKRATCHPHLACYKRYCKTCKYKATECAEQSEVLRGSTEQQERVGEKEHEGTLRVPTKTNEGTIQGAS